MTRFLLISFKTCQPALSNLPTLPEPQMCGFCRDRCESRLDCFDLNIKLFKVNTDWNLCKLFMY